MFKSIFLLGAVIFGCAAKNRSFPDNFKWGVSTAAYQIEGGWAADGKGPSMVDILTTLFPSKFQNDTGAVACDSYHKWREDIALLKELGVTTYRLSVSWSRILPLGNDLIVNQNGINYYLNIFKALKEAGIEPYVTLYHFDTPSINGLVDLMNDPNYNILQFANYARVCFKNFGEYVKQWYTINEPLSLALSSEALLKKEVYGTAKSLLLMHAAAWSVYDEEFRASQKGNISIVFNSHWSFPLNSSDPQDVKIANQDVQFALDWFAHPIYFGNWPQIMIDRIGNLSKAEGLNSSRLPEFTQSESDSVKGTHDFFAINHYGSYLVHPMDPNLSKNLTQYAQDTGSNRTFNASFTCPDLDQAFSGMFACAYPQGLRYLLNYVSQVYNPNEIYVTENGWPDNGGLQDFGRIAYYEDYLNELQKTMYDDHVPVTHYQAWSLMDNFEWTAGYKVKFGLVSVDFNDPNRTRTPKESFQYYKKVVAANSLDVDF